MAMTSAEYNEATSNIQASLGRAIRDLEKIRQRVLVGPSITLQAHIGSGRFENVLSVKAYAFGDDGKYIETGKHDDEQAARDELAMMAGDWARLEWGNEHTKTGREA